MAAKAAIFNGVRCVIKNFKETDLNFNFPGEVGVRVMKVKFGGVPKWSC